MSIRINSDNSRITGNFTPAGSGTKVTNFQQELLKVGTDKTSEIADLLNEIEQHGLELTKNITLKNLERYKASLQTLLSKIAQNYGLNTEHVWHHHGQQRILTAIHEIKQNMQELSDEVVAKNATGLSIMTKIDNIRGLLVDLYT